MTSISGVNALAAGETLSFGPKLTVVYGPNGAGNAPTIGAEAHLPFGGVKQTGNGHREGGWEVYEFYSETKVGYADYSGALQRAQIDNY